MSDSSVQYICLLHSQADSGARLKVTSPLLRSHSSPPLCFFFRCNTVMRSAVSQHSQRSGFFSPASDVGSAVCEEVADPPGLLFPLDFLLPEQQWGVSSVHASSWGWIMGCTGSRECVSIRCAGGRVTVFSILRCIDVQVHNWKPAV